MPAISKIRLTNVVYEDGDKRFNDEVFHFQGNNGAILLENGGGKTVFIHTVLQAILPHTNLGDRKIRDTLQLENAPAHIGIEWIINERPRRYMTTVVSLFLYNNKLDSFKYVYEYEEGNSDSLENIPFVKETNGQKRPAYKEEMAEYFSAMKNRTHSARTFDTINSFHHYIETTYHIITNEWESIVKINRDEGGIEQFFENCKTTTDLYDRLLIPTVENSITGHEDGMFADMFEKQREGFRIYRNFQNSIKEHKAIQVELESYVKQFARFSEQQIAYEKVKQRAKGLMETIDEQLIAIVQQEQENNTTWEEWCYADKQLQIQKDSYYILIEEEKANELEKLYLETLTKYEETKERLHKNEHRFYSLQYGKLKTEVAVYKQQLASYKKELDNLDTKGEVHDVEVELENEHAKLHGYFMTKLNDLEKVIKDAEFEKRPLEKVVAEIEVNINKKTIEEKEERSVFDQTKGIVQTKQEEMDALKQKVLANPEQDDIKTEFEKWTTKQQQLDEEIIQLNKEIKIAKQTLANKATERECQLKKVNDIKVHISKLQFEEEQIQQAHDQLIEQLAKIRPHWQGTEDLYLREGSYRGTLNEIVAKLTRERENLLLSERIAHRFVDDYNEQDNFFTDAFLANKITDWQNQLYIVTGPEFFANMSEDEKKTYRSYPLWPLTIITTEEDKDKLTTKIVEIKKHLQYPILILTLEQVKKIDETNVKEKWITPTHWETNLYKDTFLTWKEDMLAIAEKSTVLRVDKEKELAKVEQILHQFEQFFTKYPKTAKDKLREKSRLLYSEKDILEREITILQTFFEQTKRDILKKEERLENNLDIIKGLERRIERASEVFQLERELATLVEKQTIRNRKLNTLEKEVQQLQRELARYKDEIKLVTDRISENVQEIKIVEGNLLYKEVKDYKPIFTDDAYEVIIERRRTIEYKKRGIEQTYGEIQTKYEQATANIDRVEEEMKTLLQSFETIDKTMDFPVDGVSLLERTQVDIRSGKIEVEKLNEEKEDARVIFSSQKGRVQRDRETFENKYPNTPIYQFEMEIEQIAPSLKEEDHKLKERKAYIESERKRIEHEKKDIEAAAQHLGKYEVAHHFNRTTVDAISLTEKEKTDFSYGRMKFVQATIDDLVTKREQLESGKENIDRAKRVFRAFCRDHITERKLREMATEGIDLKTTYEDVLEFQQNMLTTVERADQIARNFISDKDKEVQAFINSIHNHLLNVVELLNVIPKKTKVKVGEQWKEIFKFTIPEWTEEDGKSRIRNYMDWILEQLEASYFKNEQGLEDSAKIRKQIETWLQTKSLLQVIMENEGMKVACRKVTNDNKVTSRLTSWEQSNQWSGGEKWSKNMTLFLGILNFVAEKKQPIAKTKMKRHRAVILDNPFGKASSDHVLNPVFFIAEQLGFQIIALTAHADGKFLQDYFPVIYSLRLRATEDESKQVMTKQKSVNYAYFQDHEPEVIERLEEREQLELF